MKFNLNITDMNEEEFAKLFANINVPCKTEVALVPDETEVSNSDIVPSEETVNYDVDGLQWDARIHSSNHKINSDGRWQRRRGVSDVEFNKIKNELLGVQEPVAEMVAPVVEAPVVAPVVLEPVAPVAPVVAPVVEAPVVAPVAPTPVAPVQAPVAEPTPAIDSAVLYGTMFEKIKTGLTNQKVGPNDIKALLDAINTQFGKQYTNITMIAGDIPALQFVINNLVTRGL